MAYVVSSYDTFRVGAIPTLIASNLTDNSDSFRGFLEYDGPQPEGEIKSVRQKGYFLEKTSDDAPGTVQKPSGETRVSFEETYKMNVQLNTSTAKTYYSSFQSNIASSLSSEINKLQSLLFLTALTADTNILTTKYTTTAVANLSIRTATQDGVRIIPVDKNPDSALLAPGTYGLTAFRLMKAISSARSRDARYGSGYIGNVGGKPAHTTGTPFVVMTCDDINDLRMWQMGSNLEAGQTTQYANISPGFQLERMHFHGLSSNDRGRTDLNGSIKIGAREMFRIDDFALIEARPAVEGPYGAETMLWQAPGVQKINLTGVSDVGKIDIIYYVPIAHGLHIGRGLTERTGQMIAFSQANGNHSVHNYDSVLNAFAHRYDGIGITLLEVRRPYNYNRDDGSIIAPTSLMSLSGGTPTTSTAHHKSGNKSMAETMVSAHKTDIGNGTIYSDPKLMKMTVQHGRSDPKVVYLDNLPPLQELPTETGTILASGYLPSNTLVI